MYFSFNENHMSQPKNSNNQPVAQDALTTEVDFCNTPISNTRIQILQIFAGVESRDAIQKARTLASGLGQICRHIHDGLNYGEMVYCDRRYIPRFAFFARGGVQQRAHDDSTNCDCGGL